MDEIENEEDLKMKYVVFKISDIKEILNITEQQSLWSMLNKIIQFTETEKEEMRSKQKQDRVVRRMQTRQFLGAIKERLPKQAEQVEGILDEFGLHLYDM
jgi:DNA-binding transcriptional MerR regulator